MRCLGFAALWVLLISLPLAGSAQRIQGQKNLETFDLRMMHFGFLLSYNTSSFFFDYKPDFTFQDSLQGISNVPQGGFNLALLASYNPLKNINVRFVPGLSFQDRGLEYRFLKSDGTTDIYLKRIESVWLEFPLLVKFRTNRTGNFAAYALAGGKYAMDMQSQKDVNNAVAQEIIIKLKDRDIAVEAGGGFDFFLPYFKFAIEFKTSIGLTNVLVAEPHQFAEPLSRLRTRAFVVSITFEG